MIRFHPAWAAIGAISLTWGCSTLLSGGGLGVEVAINAGPVLSQVATGRLLRIAAWVDQEPAEGVRPAEIIHIEGSDDPTELCRQTTRSSSDAESNVFWVCKTDLFVDPLHEIWIGAYYEREDAVDLLPSPGEFLTYVGPITLAPGQTQLADLEITILDPDAPDLLSTEQVVSALADALIAADADAFLDLVHPFVGNPWNFDFNEIQRLGQGGFATATTVYADPLSAPLSGMLNDDLRDKIELEELAVEVTLIDANARTARWTLSYSAKLDDNEGRFAVAEDWRLAFRETPSAVLLDYWAVDWVHVGDTTLTNASLAEGALRMEWTHPVGALATGFRVYVDTYNPNTSEWTPAVTSPTITANASGEYVCTLAAAGSCVPGVEFPDDRYYRVRIHPLDDDGRERRPAVAYIAGDTYPF